MPKAKGVLRMKNLSKRSFRYVSDGFAGKKRYKFEKIASFKDLRTFFYEYSLFIGDLQSIPGMPNFKTANSIRHTFLKSARIMGDVTSLVNTANKLFSGANISEMESFGERAFRRVGGRLTGKAMMVIPGTNPLSRAARSGIGANLQKGFDTFTKNAFRKTGMGSNAAVKVYGNLDLMGILNGSNLHKILEVFTEDMVRQAYSLTPVRTGKLRGSLKAYFKDTKVKGGFLRRGIASIGGGDIDYAYKIEYGSGKGFNVGVGQVMARYFPNTPPEVLYLRSSDEYRRAVNANTGQGAMMRRGAHLAIKRLNLSKVAKVKGWEPVEKVIADMENPK